MYSRCMPHVHLNDLWTDRRHVCITVSRRGMCFWDGWPCAMKCKKDGKAYMLKSSSCVCWKSSRKWVRFRTPHLTWNIVVSQDDHCCFASCCCLMLIHLTADFTGYWLHLYSLSLLPFLRQSPSFLPRCHCSFFCFDVATMRPLALLEH